MHFLLRFFICFYNSSDIAVHMSYCHHFASIVIVSVNFYDYIFFSEITTQLQPNLVGMFIGRISAKFMYSVPIENSTWLQGPLIFLEMLSFSDIVGMFIRSEMILYLCRTIKKKFISLSVSMATTISFILSVKHFSSSPPNFDWIWKQNVYNSLLNSSSFGVNHTVYP